ncbi:hypothetical protein WME98_51960 [Sorangium sp. So ce296]
MLRASDGPKSVTFTLPGALGSRNRFVGLRPWWGTSRACAASSTAASERSIEPTSSKLSGRRSASSASDGTWIVSVTVKGAAVAGS